MIILDKPPLPKKPKTNVNRHRGKRDAVSPPTMLDAGNLPVVELAKIAIREGRRPRTIYQTHKWFARRFGSAFRALLIAATISEKDDLWSAYLGNTSLEDLTVLDPFVGGGTSVIEAQRMGANCFAVDIDPVAVAITDFQSSLSSVQDLAPYLDQLQKTVGNRIRKYHKFLDDDGTEKEVLHHFWVQKLDCAECETEFMAHPHYQLAHDSERKIQWVVCKHCGEVSEALLHWNSFACRACSQRTAIQSGPALKGTVTCPDCGHKERLVKVSERTKGPPQWFLFALEVLESAPEKRPVPMKDRSFKKATEKDRQQFKRAESSLRRLLRTTKFQTALPDRKIPVEGRTDQRIIHYGYKNYVDLFNARQLLHLALLAEAIRELPEPAKKAFSIAFSDHLKTNCMMTNYAFGWRRLAPLFSVRSFRHVSRPVEINPWLSGTGRGTFPNAIRKVEQAAQWSRLPREFLLDGGFKPLPRICTQSDAPVNVSVGSAECLDHVPNNSVDLVLTDPPYFDNIAYSELSDFFLPWMHLLGLVDKNGEDGFPAHRLAVVPHDKNSADMFGIQLGRCFQEIGNKVKPEGRLVFTYQHKSISGWLALAKGIALSRLSIIQVFPMLGDAFSGLHKRHANISWDAVFVAVRGSYAPMNGEVQVLPRLVKSAWKKFHHWDSSLSNNETVRFREPDRANLLKACMIAAAFDPQNRSENGTQGLKLTDLLALTPAPPTKKSQVGADRQSSNAESSNNETQFAL